tara:strand:+ start:1961 stop:2167 length:207 start_codon:yes stop_codon:yes gene_type:complete
MCVKPAKTNNFSISKTKNGIWYLMHGNKEISHFRAKSRSKKQMQYICDYLNSQTINEDGSIPTELPSQ